MGGVKDVGTGLRTPGEEGQCRERCQGCLGGRTKVDGPSGVLSDRSDRV